MYQKPVIAVFFVQAKSLRADITTSFNPSFFSAIPKFQSFYNIS